MAQDARVTYLFSDGNLAGTLRAYRALLEERPDLRDRTAVEFARRKGVSLNEVELWLASNLGYDARAA